MLKIKSAKNPVLSLDLQESEFDQNLRKIARFLCIVQVGSQKYKRM
jgi:hypothetical protein